jgi:hypothetical protein
MPTQFENLKLGPCNVTFKDTDLGLTKGGVEVEFTTEVANITADQFGDTIIDDIIRGRMIKVRVPMAEADLSKLTAVIPGSTLVGTTNRKLVINAAVGTSLRALAGVLQLRPKGETTAENDVTIPLAMPKGDMQFSFKHDEQRVYAVEFTGYVDLDNDELFVLGDPTVGV